VIQVSSVTTDSPQSFKFSLSQARAALQLSSSSFPPVQRDDAVSSGSPRGEAGEMREGTTTLRRPGGTRGCDGRDI
jgi:hypothetical protein